ncbi:MAG: L-2-amino-thiazoline-4-carboxylic acid hydrolase [Myxococcales bacterium]|nr:L-2-amino-thiazoline-4-carboxylic acid hydrolase [Myxococcales bacterium]
MNKLSLLLFDLRHGFPTALRVLSDELGWAQTVRVLAVFLLAGLRDPYRSLGRYELSERERFTRHQLRPVLLLDDVLGRRFSAEETRRVLGRIVAESGARFVRHNVRHPEPAQWQAMSEPEQLDFAGKILARFGNAESEAVVAPDADFAFDVTKCHFVELTSKLERPQLATLFCAADSHFYADPSVPISLERTQTLALGAQRCTFRFRFQDGEAGSPQ